MTTTTVNLDGLRELAAFRAENGCAISLYLDLDPSIVPTAGDTATRVRSLLDAGCEVARREAPRPGARGQDRAEGRLRAARALLRRRVRPRRRARAGHLHGRARQRLERAAAAVVGSRHDASPTTSCSPRSCRCSAAATVRSWPSSGASRVACSRCAAAGSRRSPTAPRRPPAATTRAVVAVTLSSATSRTSTTSTTVGRRGAREAASGGSAVPASSSSAARRRARSSRTRSRPRSQRRSSAGRPPRRTPRRRPARGRPAVVEEWRAARESEAVERWREETGKGARAPPGWEETLEAASDGRVELLLHQEGVQRDAFRCPSCGRAALGRDDLPARRDDDGAARRRPRPRRAPDARARRRRPRRRAPQDLDPVEGIGAILRF